MAQPLAQEYSDIESDALAIERSGSESVGLSHVADVESGFHATPRIPHVLRHPLAASAWLIQLVFGSICGLLLLSFAATVPGLNLFALGYLLDAEGNVARTGQWWRAMPQLPALARLGTISIGCIAWLFPVWYMADAARDAALIAPHAGTTTLRFVGLIGLAILVAIHLVIAMGCGGSAGCFFRPIKNIRSFVADLRRGDYWERAQRAVLDFLRVMRLPQRLWIGTCGFFGTLAWLVGPSLLLAALQDPANSLQQLLTLWGGLSLIPVLAWLPFLQARSSAENRWRGIFELGAVRELFRHAPLAWLIAIVVLYGSAVPLYFYSFWMKMQLQPHRGILDLTLISVVTTYPGRMLVGWAYHRAVHRPVAWSGWGWFVRPVLAGLLGAFIYLLFLSSITAEFGRHWLNQHHALLLPIPW